MRERAITSGNFGAWVLKCNPKVWDLEWYVGLGLDSIDSWSLGDSYRLKLMQKGQPVVFWVSGAERGRVVYRGVWGFGHLTSSAYESVGLLPHEIPDSGWLDSARAQEPGHAVSAHIPLLTCPIPASELRADPVLAQSEIFRAQQMSNPVFLTKEEFAAIKRVRKSWAASRKDGDSVAVFSNGGAGFGTAEQNKKIEVAAMTAVRRHYENQGFEVRDVSAQKVGWDLTALPPTKRQQPRFVEVKGVSGSAPKVLLTRNEYAAAEREPLWELAVVTTALSNPRVAVYTRGKATRSSTTFVWEADLT